MRRYWRVWNTFVRASIARDLEFRANFFAKVLQNLVWFIFFLVIVQVLYANTTSIAGWSHANAYVLTGTITLVDATLILFAWGLTEVPSMVRSGTLDFLVSKPVDSLFWISMRMFRMENVGRWLAGLGLVIWGVHLDTGHVVTLPDVGGYVFLCIAAILTYYSLMTLLMTLAIWFVRVDNLWVIGDVVQMMARNPIDIWPNPGRKLLTYWLPIALFATLPASSLKDAMNPQYLLLGLVWMIGSLIVVRMFWNYSMRHYSSASS